MHDGTQKLSTRSVLDHPYYIYAPAYTETSSGVRALHYLCHALNLSGRHAYICGTNVVNTDLKTPILTEEERLTHESKGLVPIAVYPEVVSGNPLGTKVVARYIFNRIGFISGKGIDAEKKDLYFYYDEAFRINNDRIDGYLKVPITDISSFTYAQAWSQRFGSFLQLNRYRETRVKYSCLPEDVRILSTRNPVRLEELASIFHRAERLYSYEYSHT